MIKSAEDERITEFHFLCYKDTDAFKISDGVSKASVAWTVRKVNQLGQPKGCH